MLEACTLNASIMHALMLSCSMLSMLNRFKSPSLCISSLPEVRHLSCSPGAEAWGADTSFNGQRHNPPPGTLAGHHLCRKLGVDEQTGESGVAVIGLLKGAPSGWASVDSTSLTQPSHLQHLDVKHTRNWRTLYLLDSVQEFGSDDATALPDSGKLSQIQVPLLLHALCSDQVHALSVAADLGSIQSLRHTHVSSTHSSAFVFVGG